MTNDTLPTPRARVRALTAAATAMRRDLHEHAELSTKEHRTQGVILGRLRDIGADDVRESADTGATCVIRGERPGPNVLWRADIDGLPLTEATGLSFASTNGAMHACGHDGHTSIGLALAELLQDSRSLLAGNVRIAFQPAEEHVGGARRMIDGGIMDEPRIARVFGLHIWASAPTGTVLVREGSIFAAATHFRIVVRGHGGHAAAPHQTVDPILVAAHVITALQSVVSRNTDPEQTAVLTVGRIDGGVRGNIIPNEVMMSGTIRTFEAHVLERVLRRAEEIIAGVTHAFGAEYQFDSSTLAACVNDPESAALVAAAATAFVGEDRVTETRATGADDMCLFLEAAPGAYFLLGAAPSNAERVYPHHHPRFDFDEDALPIGIEMALRVIEAATGCELG